MPLTEFKGIETLVLSDHVGENIGHQIQRFVIGDEAGIAVDREHFHVFGTVDQHAPAAAMVACHPLFAVHRDHPRHRWQAIGDRRKIAGRNPRFEHWGLDISLCVRPRRPAYDGSEPDHSQYANQ